MTPSWTTEITVSNYKVLSGGTLSSAAFDFNSRITALDTTINAQLQRPRARAPAPHKELQIPAPINFFDSPLAEYRLVWYNKSYRGHVKQCLSWPLNRRGCFGHQIRKASN